MFSGKDALRWLPTLAAGLACVGCFTGSPRLGRPAVADLPRGPDAPPTRASFDTSPPPPVLQISGAPAPAAAAPSGALEVPPLAARPPAPAPETTRVTAAAALPPAAQLAEPPPPPPAARPPADPLDDLRRLHAEAARQFASLNGYTARLTRREQVNGKSKPEEVMLCKFRRQPFSVHFKWVGTTAKGREVVYVQGQHQNKLHTLTSATDSVFLKAGSRISLPLTDPNVVKASRHSIAEAGLGSTVEHLGRAVAAEERGARRLRYLGKVNRPEFRTALEGVEEQMPPGADPSLPRGGRRLYFFDPASHLPVLLLAYDERGQEAEYYRYEDLRYPVQLTDDDFNPDRLWPSRR